MRIRSDIVLVLVMFCTSTVYAQKIFPMEEVMVNFKRPPFPSADSLRKALHMADTLDELIPWMMLQGRWVECHQAIEQMESQLDLLRQSMGYLSQHMAYQKKVEYLGQKLSDYRLHLYRQAMRPSAVILSPAVVQVNSHSSGTSEILSAKIRQLELDTARLQRSLLLAEAEKDSIIRENLLLRHKLNKFSDPLVIGISLGIQLGSCRHSKQILKD